MQDDTLELTVSDYLFGPARIEILAEKACESDYWQNAEEFVIENQGLLLKELSPKQRDWLMKIREDLLDESFN